jgi:hypothetical protein
MCRGHAFVQSNQKSDVPGIDQQFAIEQAVRGCEYKLWRDKRPRTVHPTAKKRDRNYTDSGDWPDGGISYFSVMLIVTGKYGWGLSRRAGRWSYHECNDTN